MAEKVQNVALTHLRGKQTSEEVERRRAQRQREEQKAREQQDREQRKAQIEAEKAVLAEIERENPDVDITVGKFSYDSQGGRLTKAYGTESASARRERIREAEKQQEFALAKQLTAEAKAKGATIKGPIYTSRPSGQTQGQLSAMATFEYPVTESYVNPTYNQYFGTRRIGDIVSEEVAKGESGLYRSRKVYENEAIRDYLAGFSSTKKQGDYDFYVPMKKYLQFQGPQMLREYQGPPEPTRPLKFQGQPEIKNDFLSGFIAPFENIGKTYYYTFGDLFGFTPQARVRKPRLAEELEGGAISISVSGVIEGVGKGSLTETSRQTEAYLKSIRENPAYYTGSGVASAVMWLGPYGIQKAYKFFSGAIAARGASKALTPLGNIVNVEKSGFVNIGKEGDIYRYAVGAPIKIGKEPGIEFFSRYPATSAKDLLLSPKRLTQYVGSQLFGLKEGSRPFSSEFIVKGGQLNYPEIAAGARGETLFKVAKPGLKAIATSESYTMSELSKLLSTEEGVKKFLGISDDILRFTAPGGTGPMKPFTYEVTKPLLESAKIISKPLPGAAAIGASGTVSLGKDFSQNQFLYLPRLRSQRDVYDYEYLYQPIPGDRVTDRGEKLAYQVEMPSLDKATKTYLKGLEDSVRKTSERLAIDTGQRFRGGEKTRPIYEFSLDKVLRSLQETATRQKTESITGLRTSDLAVTGLAEVQISALAQPTLFRTAPRLTKRIPPLPPIVEAWFPGSAEPRKSKKKRRKGKRLQKKTKVRDLAELAFGKDFAKDFNKKFSLRRSESFYA